MKNTRIERLKHSKRVKQATKLLTVGLLVCPLAIGTIKALADEVETTTPPVEQVAETPATTEEVAPVEETETTESVQPEVIEETQPVTEEPPAGTTETETIQSIENSQTASTQEVVSQKNLINSWYSIEGSDVIGSGETASYRFFFNTIYDDDTSTKEELTLQEMGAQLTSSDPSDVISGNTITFGDVGTRIISTTDSGMLVVSVIDENNTLYRVYYVYEDGSPLLGGTPTSHTRYATAGEEVTEVAQEIPGYSIVSESTQTKTIARDGSTVFTFVYRNDADKTKLKQAIEEAEAKLSEGGWKDTTELEALLEYAKSALVSNYPPQGTIDDITASLIAALSALEKEETETPTLDELIEKFNNKQAEASTLLDEVKALAEGTEFYERYKDIYGDYDMVTFLIGNWQGTQEEYYTWGINQYTDVISQLNTLKDEINATQPETPTTEKLETSIKEAESKLTESGYTEESMKALIQTLQNAKDVLANTNSTQAEIDEAQKALDLAIAGLVKTEEPNGNNTGNDGSNSTGNSTTFTPNSSNNGANNTNNQTNSNNNQNSNTATTKPAGNSSNKDGLPQTGEQSTTNAVIAGLSLTMLSIFAWFKRKKV